MLLAPDLLLHEIAAALLLMLAALLARDVRGTAPGRVAALFAFSSAVFALTSAAGFAAWPVLWRAPLSALSTGNVVVLWLFARALFDDAFRLRPAHAGIWAAFALAGAVQCAAPAALGPLPLGLILNLMSLVVIGLALVQTVSSWSIDLVEGRRRLRLFIVGAAALCGGAYAVLQLLAPAQASATASAAVLLAVVVAVFLGLVRAGDSDGIFAHAAPVPAELAPPVPIETAPDAADRKLTAALDRLMMHDRIYRQEGLTIGQLALRLGVPDYRLRKVINQHLGYRNFSAFVNGYRISEAKAALADPAQVAVPITTIALDAGFQSLGPFNRAFKAATGVTPTDFRRTAAGPGEGASVPTQALDAVS